MNPRKFHRQISGFFADACRLPQRRARLAWLVLPAAALALTAARPVSQAKPPWFHSLQFRYIGPPGNRVSAVAGVPGDWNVYYAGAASGGVWKSSDGGISWRPVFDHEPAQSIGSIAIAPGHPNTVWVGTGEPFIRSNVSIGDGIYKSTDGGKTWKHLGLEKTGRISRIVIDPRHPRRVFACAMGTLYGPQQSRGVFRTVDGGQHWKRVLFAGTDAGCSDLAMDARNPRILLAGTWQMVIHTWGKYSGGPESGLFITHDSGRNWKRIQGHGLPPSPWGKIAVGIAPSDPRRMYALIENSDPGKYGMLFRSDNGGAGWKAVSYARILDERPDYTTRFAIAPNNSNEVVVTSNYVSLSYDGGLTSKTVRWGGDTHDIWFDPSDARRIMIGDDGGVNITTNGGRGWHRVTLPNAQIYHVATDDRIPYYVYGNEQDNESVRGPSDSRGYFIPSGLWRTTAGCESGFSYPEPANPNIVWGSCYGGYFARYNLRTNQTRAVSPWPDEVLDSPADAVRYRWNWTPPLLISPWQPHTVYVGSQYVHVTTDGGQSWKSISPDLTRDQKKRMGPSGGLWPDNLGVEYWGTLFALAASPRQPGLLWAGSNDGLVHLSRDYGKHWQDVTANIAGIPKYGTISSIFPSPYNAGAAYIAVNAHQINDRNPYIFKTSDYGRSWKKIINGIPPSVFSYVHIVIEDPVRRGLLYAGTENGLYVSFDDGANWQPLQNNLPHVPVSWLTIQPRFDDLVVATKGRGIWILDDLAPLQQATKAELASPVQLFHSRPAYRFRKVGSIRQAGDDVAMGRNPPFGADINFYLRTAPPAKPAASMEILDQRGKLVRRLKLKHLHAGLNRVWWDLRYPKPHAIKLRTSPAAMPHIWYERRFWYKETRTIYHWGNSEAQRGPLAAPGIYSVRLQFAGTSQTTTLTVLKDPHSAGTLRDIHQDVQFLLALRSEIGEVARTVNQIERIRVQLQQQRTLLRKDHALSWVLARGGKLDGQLREVEDQLLQRKLAWDDRKSYMAPMKLYSKLLWLYGEAGSGVGDVSGDPDFPPTSQELAVAALLHGRLERALSGYQVVLTRDIPAYNQALRAQQVFNLIVPGATSLHPQLAENSPARKTANKRKTKAKARKPAGRQ